MEQKDSKFISPENFNCTKCGECCRPIVKVNEQEISKIEQTGINKKDFTVYDQDIKSLTLKQKNGVCMFLKKDVKENGENIFVCSIYEHRPETCRKYPFFTEKEKLIDCRPNGWQRWRKIEDIVE